MNFFFGPMSKNVVDSIIDFSIINPDINITLIPSRRQIEYNGGYVNNWTTREFAKYVKEKNSKIKIERDHSGPSQGTNIDDGFESLKEDAKYMDIIHIDPWKYCDNIEDGIEWTAKMILFCDNINPLLEYEIATEEAIYALSVIELEYIINKLKIILSPEIFQKIKYLVIQCGTKLSTGENIGSFDENKLIEMLALSKKYNLIAKEHNGDWVNNEIIIRKQNLGLTSINIAPEMGEIETKVILNYVSNDTEDYSKIYELCIESGKWKKWVGIGFDYINEKDKIILITGHYIFSHPEFQKIKEKYDNIDLEIKEAITNRLLELFNW